MKLFEKIYRESNNRYYVCWIIFENGHRGRWRANTFFNLRAKLANWFERGCKGNETTIPCKITDTNNCEELSEVLNKYIDELDRKNFCQYKLPIEFKVEPKGLKESQLEERGLMDLVASAAQELPFEGTRKFARAHWKKTYPEEFAAHEEKEREFAETEKLRKRDEKEALDPRLKRARLKKEWVSDMMKRARDYKGYSSPNNWKAYIDDLDTNDPEIQELFKIGTAKKSSDSSIKKAIILTIPSVSGVSSNIIQTCLNAIRDGKKIGPKGPARKKKEEFIGETELFESILGDDENLRSTRYKGPTVSDEENLKENMRLFESVYRESFEDEHGFDNEWGNQKTERFRMEHDNLDDQCWQHLTDWDQLPEYDETVFEAVMDGELDEEIAKKILVFCYHWELEDVERELAPDSNTMRYINDERRQQNTWSQAGIDEDSIGDGRQFDDDYVDPDDDNPELTAQGFPPELRRHQDAWRDGELDFPDDEFNDHHDTVSFDDVYDEEDDEDEGYNWEDWN